MSLHKLQSFALLAVALAAASSCSSGSSETLPAGTVLYLRLDTAVSTASSHAHAKVTARVVREVPGQGGVAIPLGATVQGSIAKLVASSKPDERSELRLDFTKLLISGERAAKLAGHVKDVPNARETVQADGTMEGVLESEMPATELNRGLAKLGQALPGIAGEVNQAKSSLGTATTAIQYPAGTDLEFVLDKPLAVNRVFPSSVQAQLPSELDAALATALASAPARASGKDNKPGDPVNLVVIGSAQQIVAAFRTAGWTTAERQTSQSILDTVRAVINDDGYGQAPVSDLYLYGRREDLAYEKMLNTFAKRHHLRLWRSGAATPDGREIWLGAATHDVGFDLVGRSHAIDPNLDAERAQVGADLEAAGAVAAEQLVSRPNPVTSGLTATGGSWEMDGRLLAIELKSGAGSQ